MDFELTEDQRAQLRAARVGFVFQAFHLLPSLTALENVLLPSLAGFAANGNLRERALQLIERVGLEHRTHQRPGQLSGGERQRVAVCRALLQQPSLLLADEPTGNLDPVTATEIGSLLLEMAAENQSALLCVTHSDELASRFPQSLTLTNGTADLQ